MVVLVVQHEPFSIQNSLINSEFTGYFVIFDTEMGEITSISMTHSNELQRKFPTQYIKEFLAYQRI